MSINEKATLFILMKFSGQAFKGVSERDIRDEYDYALKDMVRDGLLDKNVVATDEGEQRLEYSVNDYGKRRKRMLLEKWEEEN